jgi:ornithine carbamoyltransferase
VIDGLLSWTTEPQCAALFFDNNFRRDRDCHRPQELCRISPAASLCRARSDRPRWCAINFNVREATSDLAGYLDNWFDVMVIRTKELDALKALSAAADAAVINARTQSNHPCETLGDLAYINRKRGGIGRLKVVGVAPDANILRSWVEASISLPLDVVQVYPETWHVRDAALLNADLRANFRVSTDMAELSDADVIITDSWPDEASAQQMSGYRISASELDGGRDDLIFLPCPPVSRGQEVTADAMNHAACQSRQAKAFLLHAQNALLEWIVS